MADLVIQPCCVTEEKRSQKGGFLLFIQDLKRIFVSACRVAVDSLRRRTSRFFTPQPRSDRPSQRACGPETRRPAELNEEGLENGPSRRYGAETQAQGVRRNPGQIKAKFALRLGGFCSRCVSFARPRCPVRRGSGCVNSVVVEAYDRLSSMAQPPGSELVMLCHRS